MHLPFLFAPHSRDLFFFPFLSLSFCFSHWTRDFSVNWMYLDLNLDSKCETVSNNASYTINQLSLLNLPWTVAYRIFLCIVYSNKSWDCVEYKAQKQNIRIQTQPYDDSYITVWLLYRAKKTHLLKQNKTHRHTKHSVVSMLFLFSETITHS